MNVRPLMLALAQLAAMSTSAACLERASTESVALGDIGFQEELGPGWQ